MWLNSLLIIKNSIIRLSELWQLRSTETMEEQQRYSEHKCGIECPLNQSISILGDNIKGTYRMHSILRVKVNSYSLNSQMHAYHKQRRSFRRSMKLYSNRLISNLMSLKCLITFFVSIRNFTTRKNFSNLTSYLKPYTNDFQISSNKQPNNQVMRILKVMFNGL